MIAGRARITVIDAEGRSLIDDVGIGNLWYFPAGIPHSIQGRDEGCEFLLVFDDGGFSVNETFLLTDWFRRTPRDVLAKDFGVPEAAFADIPIDVDRERYILTAPVPPAGTCGIVDSSSFPVARTIAAALVEVEPGAVRELHWHPNTDEWQYYLSGSGRMTVFASSSGKARTFDYRAGDVGYVPFAMGHYVENTGEEPLRFLEMFRGDRFADVSLRQGMVLTPPELVRAHLNLDPRIIAGLSRDKPIIVR
jgi:oxalate decarboxylase